VKETLVLGGPDAPASYVFPLRLKGLTPRLVDGQVAFLDASGVRRAVIPAGTMVDAHGAASNGVRFQLSGNALELSVDTAWLRDPARAFPVSVDPTVQLPVNSGTADSSLSVSGGGSSGGSSSGGQQFEVGSNSAGYIKFGDLVNRLQYHTIFGAQLWTVNYDADSCNPRPVTVHPVTEAWDSSTQKAFPGPAVGDSLASKSFAHGYIAFGQPASACPRAGELFNLGAGGRDLVQRWVNGDQPNYGLSLRGTGAKKFTGPATANPPKLFVTHSQYNALYKLTDPRPNPPVLQNQDGKVKITVTNKSAAAWAPGDYYLAYRAYKADTGASVIQQRSANLTASVPRGGKVTLDATIKALPPGKYFLDLTMVKTGGPVFTDHQVPPGRIVLQVFDIPPVLQELFPPNGYQAPTLTPQLWARALDIDAPPSSSLQFKFEVCERDPAAKPINCVNSGYGTKTAWTVSSGTLSWSKSYMWRAFVKDATTEVPSPYSVLLSNVPQPEITSHVSSAPNAMKEQDFDPQTGNYTTAAIDATVNTVGPQLNVARTYNRVDPRRDGMFGAGWTTSYDMKLVTDDDGSGNVVVTHPDGQTVRFGRNADGTYAAPLGRSASLTVDSTSWKLLDKSGTTYQFALTGKLTRITDISNRSVVVTYTDGKVSKAQVSNSQTNTTGRALTFTWTGNHVTSVRTDAVDGAPLTWSYAYNGDLLTQVCSGTACTKYDYSQGSHYRSAVLDSRPESYWRLGESDGTQAGSEVAVNLGKDTGTYKNVTLATPGQLVGTTDTAATFNGTTSSVDLPKGTVKKSRDGAIELWFKNSITGSGGPLIGYQDKALGSAATVGVPVLYVGTDGKLHGQFATGSITPIASPGTVNDGRWHHVVLSSMGSTQTMYLDGVKAGELTGKTIDHTLLTFNQIGAAYASTPATWPAWGTTAQRSYNGSIDEVAIYSGPLGPASVAAHYNAATTQANQLSKVTLPSGRIAASTTYDVSRDRVKEYTDSNGGTWKVGAPTVYGGDTDLRRSVEVLDPANRTSLYEFDAIAGRLLRLGLPLGMEARPDDKPGEPAETPPDPVEQCSQPDPNDPAFCTTIPSDSGGPVFVRYGVDGVSIRTYFYNDDGTLKTVTDENGDSTSMTYDARGNVTSQKTCRSSTECYTSYKSFPTTITNPYDPRNDMPTETRDGRSASATDNTYRTQYTYHPSGQLATQTRPDGSGTSNTYTTGGEAAVNGGNPPAGLLNTSANANGKITRYAYFANGDLAKVTEPSGLVTEFGYDAIGRQTSRKQTSDSFPAGVVSTLSYDAMSRPRVSTAPVTTNAVTGVKHQQRVTTSYDLDGNIQAVETADVLGNDPARTTSTVYNEHGQAITVTDAEGGETGYDYDLFGNVLSKTDSNGNRYDYAYTARNSIAEVRLRNWHSDPAGAPATGEYLVLDSYAYDPAGRLASMTDAMGRRTAYEYYDDGLPKRSVLKDFHNPDGTKRDYVLEENTYDGAGNPTKKVTDNGKTVTTNVIDKLGRVGSAVTDPDGLKRTNTFTYDGAGNVKSVILTGSTSNVPWVTANSQQKVTYDYDDSDNLIQQTIVGATSNRVTKTTYDQRGLAVSTTDARGTAQGADPAYTSKTTYDELGQPVAATGPPVTAESYGQPAATVNATIATGYDTFGAVVDAKDPLGRVTHTAYDRNGRVVTTAQPSYQAPGSSQPFTSTTTTKYDGNSNVIEVKDPRGNITRNTYDQLDRVTTVDRPASVNDERAVTAYTYTRSGQVLSVVDPMGGRTESTYDDLDRPVTSTDVERKPAAGAFTTKITYDDADNSVNSVTPTGSTSVYTYDTLSQLTKSLDPNNVQTQYGYDFAGQQVRAADGLGRTEQTSYDLFGQKVADASLKADGTQVRSWAYGYDSAGNLTTTTDPLQVTSTYTYDAANHLVKQVQPVADGKAITTSFGFDAAGNRTRSTDGRTNSTFTTFNTLGLPESTIEPATTAHPNAADRTWTTGYDQNGNAVSLTAPGGVTRTRTYDAANRSTGETGSGAEAATTARTLTYDLADRLTQVSAVGGTNTYTYDDRGNLFNATGPGGNADFRYDNDGNPSSRTDAAGSATYNFTKDRLVSVTDGLTGVSEQFGYDSAGMVKSLDYGGGRVRSIGYDDIGRTKTDTLSNAAKQTVGSITYDYYPDDTISAKTTAGLAGPGQQSYTYDQAGRLSSSTASGVTTGYEWDDAGNRTKVGTKTSTYDERNRLQSDGDSTYSYSARGDLRSKTTGATTTQYSFDAFDRMVNAGPQTYGYDGLDRVNNRNSTQFTYAGSTDDIVSDGTETYARGPGDELLATGRGPAKRLSLQDSHGDVVAGFDPADNALAGLPDSTGYDPFGKVTAKTGNTGSLGYQGDWTDQATGAVDMGARWYDPSAGGFTSRDDYDTGNRYAYGGGDPVASTDPTGHFQGPHIPAPHIPKPKIPWKKIFKTGGKYLLKGGEYGWKAKHFFPISPLDVFLNVLTTNPQSDDCADYWQPVCAGMLHLYPPPSVHDQFCDTHSWTSQCGGTGTMPGPSADPGTDTGPGNRGRGPGAGPGDAAQRAAEAALQAYLRAKAVSDAARAANDYGAKHNPIKIDPRAGRPVDLAPPVSSTPSAPAGVVGAVRDVVADARADTEALYDAAVQRAGQVQHNVSTATEADAEDEDIFYLRNTTLRGGDCRQRLPEPDYKPLDPANGNRATGVEACLTAENIKGGTHARKEPSGYQWAKTFAESIGDTPSKRWINACHLLAGTLGGSGKDLRNLSTCSRAANSTRNIADDPAFAGGHMRDFESDVKDAVTKQRQIVDYQVIPVYKGRRTIPVAYEMSAEGVYRDGTPGIHMRSVVPNMIYSVKYGDWRNLGLQNRGGQAVPYGPMP
jgi:RHS repeat-associated protein